MDNEIDKFVKAIIKEYETKNDNTYSNIIKILNEFLFANYKDIGKTQALGKDYDYFSDFHKYWESHFKDSIKATINDDYCSLVADALHDIYKRTDGLAFKTAANTFDLNKKDICLIRFLTANQDFRGSRKFESLINVFNKSPKSFNPTSIQKDPSGFLKLIGFTKLSQNDKRETYAKKICEFLEEKGAKTPYELITIYKGDLLKLRQDLTSYQGAGYGNKKTDMFIRDMVVNDVWPISEVKNFDKINVASDINTIKVALKTGILQTKIPLVSSFLDYFGRQYGYIDEMSAMAWRRVWEKWKEKYPNECVLSPCLIDYFVYNHVGKVFCKEKLAFYLREDGTRSFYYGGGKLSKDPKDKKFNVKLISKCLPCEKEEGIECIKRTEFYKSNCCKPNINNCPFKTVCDKYNKKYLMPPKSISIEGETGWATAYSKKGEGGGGLMA